MADEGSPVPEQPLFQDSDYRDAVRELDKLIGVANEGSPQIRKFLKWKGISLTDLDLRLRGPIAIRGHAM